MGYYCVRFTNAIPIFIIYLVDISKYTATTTRYACTCPWQTAVERNSLPADLLFLDDNTQVIFQILNYAPRSIDVHGFNFYFNTDVRLTTIFIKIYSTHLTYKNNQILHFALYCHVVVLRLTRTFIMALFHYTLPPLLSHPAFSVLIALRFK